MFHIRYVDKLILLIEEFMHCRQSFSFNLKEHSAELVQEEKKPLLQLPSQFLSLDCILISKSYISQVIACGGDTSSTNKQKMLK